MARIKLFEGNTYATCTILRSRVESEGIPATVMGDTLGSHAETSPSPSKPCPRSGSTNPTSPALRPILEDFLASDQNDNTPTPPPWQCNNCNHDIEGQFAICWNCGADRPDLA